MRRLLAIGLLVSGCCCPIDLSGDSDDATGSSAEPAAAPTATAYDAAYVDSHLARLRAAAGCDSTRSATLGHFCPAVTGWASGTAATLPTSNAAYPGVTTWIPTTTPVDVAYQRIGRFSVLAFQGGTQGDLTSPSQRAGDPAPAQAMQAVVQRLSGQGAGPIPIQRGLFGFVSGRPLAARYPVARTASGWQLQGGSYADLRRVGDTWVAVEVPRTNPEGLYFSVFVDAPTVGVGL